MTGGRVLVVDDDPILRQSLVRLLEEEGYVVDDASDGVDALARISEQAPDAILLDVLMPRMNGKQFLEALRRSQRTSAIPVVVMTAVSGMMPQHTAVDPDELVEKPFDVEDLLNKIALAVYRAHDLEGEEVGSEASPAQPPPCPAPAAGPDRSVVLLFDRDPTFPHRLEDALADRGCTAVSLPRATADLPRLARVLEPRAIAVDLSMLGERRYELFSRLREDPALRGVPVFVYAESREELAELESWPPELNIQGLARGEVLDRLLEMA